MRTPLAEKHISVLFESSSVTKNWCTEGEREQKDDGVREQMKTKQSKDKWAAITRVSRHVYTDLRPVAVLADKSNLNTIEQCAEVFTALDFLCVGTQFSVKLCFV